MALSPTDPRQALIDALLLLEEQLGTTLEWAGQDVPCVGALESDGKKLDFGGFKLYSDVRIKVRTAAFQDGSGLPQVEHTVLYSRGPDADAIQLRIVSIDRYWDVALMLHCNHPAQGG